ncbi:MAG: sigma-70 family RNA polymerase sigma factor [Tyzzerella sp.]|nr:sigma-70 family RNA polymerase sigma factor [Tyzzerella sp.]
MEDKRIVDLYWERSERAIVETKLKYGSRCMYIANHILKNQEDAEECENDTYWTIWKLIPPQRPEFLGAFITKIVRNLSLKKLEYNQAKKRKMEPIAEMEELSHFMRLHNDVNEAMEVSILTECINQFLMQEKKENRVIFLRKYWYFESNEEIARRYDMTEARVKGTLFRSRKRLRRYLEKEGWYV